MKIGILKSAKGNVQKSITENKPSSKETWPREPFSRKH